MIDGPVSGMPLYEMVRSFFAAPLSELNPAEKGIRAFYLEALRERDRRGAVAYWMGIVVRECFS